MKELKVSLGKLFGGLQRQLSETLKTTRENSTHHGTAGGAAEDAWIAVLDKHLPRRYSVRRAIVIDSWGRSSKQLDIVVFDAQYSPFLLNMDGMTYVPAESVYATMEVKPAADAENWADAEAKAHSVRSLFRTSAPIVHAGGVFAPRALPRIIAGIVADTSSWSGGLAGKGFRKHVWGASETSRLDIGCILSEGAFAFVGNGPETQLVTSDSGNALVVFLLKLLELLQQQGTVPAMDIGQYSKALPTKSEAGELRRSAAPAASGTAPATSRPNRTSRATLRPSGKRRRPGGSGRRGK